ncbi:MAG: acylphosphatase [Verrucomicrobiota bacterium]
MNKNVFQLNCWFEGRVQGVGFRYQTVVVAKGFDLSGQVENLVDGRVHLYAEGEETEVLDFLKELESEMENYIRKKEVKTSSGPRMAAGFRIVR